MSRGNVAPAGKGSKDRLWGKDRANRGESHESIFGERKMNGGSCQHKKIKPSKVEGFMECEGCGLTRKSFD